MKKKLVLLFCLVACVINAQMATEKKLPWDYPVKMESPEWEKLQFGEPGELLAALQIPEDVLSSLSTEDLTAICLKYPFIRFITYGAAYDERLDLLFEEFNGIRELFKRNDASKELLKQHELMIKNLSFLEGEAPGIEKSRFTFTICAVEILLSRFQFHDNDQKSNYIEILQSLVSYYEKMHLYKDYFGILQIRSNAYSKAKILVKIDEKNIDKIPLGYSNRLFNKESQLDEQTERAINELSYQFTIKNN